MLSGKLFQFSTVLTAKECFLMSVLAYWETRPLTPAMLQELLAPALLFVIVNNFGRPLTYSYLPMPSPIFLVCTVKFPGIAPSTFPPKLHSLALPPFLQPSPGLFPVLPCLLPTVLKISFPSSGGLLPDPAVWRRGPGRVVPPSSCHQVVPLDKRHKVSPSQ